MQLSCSLDDRPDDETDPDTEDTADDSNGNDSDYGGQSDDPDISTCSESDSHHSQIDEADSGHQSDQNEANLAHHQTAELMSPQKPIPTDSLPPGNSHVYKQTKSESSELLKISLTAEGQAECLSPPSCSCPNILQHDDSVKRQQDNGASGRGHSNERSNISVCRLWMLDSK